MYIVYKTTNKLNNKIYIGCHKTDNINDGYLGSGTALKKDLKEYGEENFTRETIKEFEDRSLALEYETFLVTKEFVSREDTYNIRSGGGGDFTNINKNFGIPSELQIQSSKRTIKIAKEKFLTLIKNKKYAKEHGKKSQIGIKRNHPNGVKLSEEAKRKISENSKIHSKGERNSQYGTIWIYNLEVNENKKINKNYLDEWLSKGWLKGRKVKFNYKES